MKTFKILLGSLVLSSLLWSCSSDDANNDSEEEEVLVGQEITIENDVFTVNRGIYEDYGIAGSGFLEDGIFFGKYEVDVYIGNGKLVQYQEDGETYQEFSEDAEIVFATDFYANATDSFEYGTFTIITDSDDETVRDASFAFETYIDIIDSEDGTGYSYEGLSGEITFTDNGDNNYTLSVDGTFEKTFDEDQSTVEQVDINFTYTGSFLYANFVDTEAN